MRRCRVQRRQSGHEVALWAGLSTCSAEGHVHWPEAGQSEQEEECWGSDLRWIVEQGSTGHAHHPATTIEPTPEVIKVHYALWLGSSSVLSVHSVQLQPG